MAVHDFGYRGYEGVRSHAWSRALAIAWSEVVLNFKTKKFLVFYVGCISPAVVAFVLLYLRFVLAEGQGELAGVQFNRGFARFLGGVDRVEFFLDTGRGFTTMLAILFSAVVGAGVISRDRRAGALELYFTRGIRPSTYVAGKVGGVFFLMLCQLLFPLLAAWLFGVAVATEESGFVARTTAFMPRLVLAQAFLSATLAFWAVSLSASTDSARFALLRWVGGLFALQVASALFFQMFKDPTWLVISPWRAVRGVNYWLAGADPWSRGPELEPALIAWVALTIAAGIWLRRHLRPVEVVA
jgi:ABC-type transport system involved in multi-copper enzyme maturation permease subunit